MRPRPTTLHMSPWQDPPAPKPLVSGVVQIKLLGQLVDYPAGKSAMVWYGAGPSIAATATAGLEQSRRALDPDVRLQWRYAAVDSPQQPLRALVRRFVDRFGGLPCAQQKAQDGR